MLGFYRGSTPTIKLTPSDGLSVSDLGNPVIAISQEGMVLTFENDMIDEDDNPIPDRIVVDTVSNSYSVTLTESETLSLGSEMTTGVQLSCYRHIEVSEGEYEDEILRFPIHYISVFETILDTVIPEDEEEVEPEPVVPEEIIEDPTGPIDVDIDDYDDFYVPDYQEYYGDTYEDEVIEEQYDPDDVEPVDPEDSEIDDEDDGE